MGSIAQAIVASVEMLIGFGMFVLASRLLNQTTTRNELARVIEVAFYVSIAFGIILIVGGAIDGAKVL